MMIIIDNQLNLISSVSNLFVRSLTTPHIEMAVPSQLSEGILGQPNDGFPNSSSPVPVNTSRLFMSLPEGYSFDALLSKRSISFIHALMDDNLIINVVHSLMIHEKTKGRLPRDPGVAWWVAIYYNSAIQAYSSFQPTEKKMIFDAWHTHCLNESYNAFCILLHQIIEMHEKRYIEALTAGVFYSVSPPSIKYGIGD